MSSERLSKLQKWILNRTFELIAISKKGMKRYFNKNLRDGLTNNERVILHKSLRNLLQKELLTEGKYGSFTLTEKGFNTVLKVNVCCYEGSNVNFKGYQKKVEKELQEYERFRNLFRKSHMQGKNTGLNYE